MIKSTYVTFEQAKWLKEAGFDNIECSGYYYINKGYAKGYSFHYSDVDNQEENLILAPEQWMVLEWLRVNHHLYIIAIPTLGGYFAYKIIDVQLDPNRPIERPPYKDVSGEDYLTPMAAYSWAIDYILNNLI
jgi:hypothetical protein